MPSQIALRAYYATPPAGRWLWASARGLYLRSWRYGKETGKLVEEAEERETWSRERWQAWQAERLGFVLWRARKSVPFYREHWAERRRNGDRASADYLENWPLVEKRSVRAHPQAFLADDCDPRRMFREHTSGTTATPLTLWWSRETVRRWYALFEARWRHWYGVSRRDRWAILGGQLVVPAGQKEPPFWVWNAPLRQLYLSTYHVAPATVAAYVDAVLRYRVVYLFGYSAALAALAQGILALGRRDLKLKAVITNAEPLSEEARALIAAAFHCPVRETYGMAEITAAAGECGHGRMHLWPDVGIVEVEDACADGESEAGGGELICTGLVNADMPLIRYRLGDRGGPVRWRSHPCACGRALPELASIEGRTDDVIVCADGRTIGRLDPIFKSALPVREAQIIQETIEHVRVLCVAAPGFSDATRREIAGRLRERLGPVHVSIETVTEIPRGANGKFRAVISKITPEKRRLAQV